MTPSQNGEPPDVHLLGLPNVTSFVADAGYDAVFTLSVLQSCCIPTSSELTLGFAGVLAAKGKLSIAGVVVAGVLGEVVGDYAALVLGRYAGRAVVDRFGRYILLGHRDLDRVEAWYDRHERFGIFGSRLLPVIRNFVVLPAGIAEVPLLRFGILTAAGSLLWDGAWAGIGYGIGAHWHAIASGVGDAGHVLAAFAVLLVGFAARHRYRSYRQAAGESRAGHRKGRRRGPRRLVRLSNPSGFGRSGGSHPIFLGLPAWCHAPSGCSASSGSGEGKVNVLEPPAPVSGDRPYRVGLGTAPRSATPAVTGTDRAGTLTSWRSSPSSLPSPGFGGTTPRPLP